ncbi:MAG: hypothetical protein ACOCXJ_03030 [Planctomycetota bacterium]
MRILPRLQHTIADCDLEALGRSADTIYLLDEELRLAGWNAAYLLFAKHNGDPELAGRFPLGTPLDAVVAPDLLPFYEQAYRTVLTTGEAFSCDYDCSSATHYRAFRMQAHALVRHGCILVSNHLRIECDHDEDGHPLSSAHRRDDGSIVQCAHCRKIRDHRYLNKWDWVPSTVAAQPLNTSHGICPLCLAVFYPDAEED